MFMLNLYSSWNNYKKNSKINNYMNGGDIHPLIKSF